MARDEWARPIPVPCTLAQHRFRPQELPRETSRVALNSGQVPAKIVRRARRLGLQGVDCFPLGPASSKLRLPTRGSFRVHRPLLFMLLASVALTASRPALAGDGPAPAPAFSVRALDGRTLRQANMGHA